MNEMNFRSKLVESLLFGGLYLLFGTGALGLALVAFFSLLWCLTSGPEGEPYVPHALFAFLACIISLLSVQIPRWIALRRER